MSTDRHAVVTDTLDPTAGSFEHALERLASAIEASIAHERASATLAAAGAENGPLPLWLVTGSSVLARWLAWSRSEQALRRVLVLSNRADTAPLIGSFKRSARVALGQTATAIRVGNGLAVADPNHSARPAALHPDPGPDGEGAIPSCQLPHTVVVALPGRSMSQLSSHPFFTAENLIIKAAPDEGVALVIDFEHEWRPLVPVPEAALAAVPVDADPAVPWRAIRREVADLYGLVDGLRGHRRKV